MNELKALKNKIILSSFFGRNLFWHFPHKYPLGCGVCFPSDPGDITDLFYNTYIVNGYLGFNDASLRLKSWNDFIAKYLQIKSQNQKSKKETDD